MHDAICRTSSSPRQGPTVATLAFLCDAYHEDEVGGELRTVLKLHPRLAPIKVGRVPARQEGRHAGEGARDLRDP